MNVAVVGCGNMGAIYASSLSLMKDVRLTAVCGNHKNSAITLAQAYGASPYDSFDEMLSCEEIDVVCITLPTFLHKDYVLKAAAHKKHIICEKPIAPNLADAREMIEACRFNGSKLFIGHVVRFFSEYKQLQQTVAAGRIGSIGVAHAKRVGSHPGAGSWYVDEEKSGGIIMDLMIHDIDFMRWVLGDVYSVYAMKRIADGIEYANVTLRFQQGAIVNLEAFWGYPGPFTTAIELAGTKGILRSNNQDQQPLKLHKKVSVAAAATGIEIPQNPCVFDPYYYELKHFLHCIEQGISPIVTAEDAYQALSVAVAANRSFKTGVAIKFPKEDEPFEEIEDRHDQLCT